MLLAAIIWEYIKAFPGALEKMTLEGLFEAVGEVFCDPEAALFAIICLLALWAVIVVFKVIVGTIDDVLSGGFGSGPQGLGLN